MLVAYVVSGLASFINNKKSSYAIDDVRDEHESKIKYYQDTIFNERVEALKDHLREISESVSLSFGMQERICVYSFIEEKNHFECVARHSAHHEYNQYSIRNEYPIDMGIIAHVWRDGKLNGFKRDQSIPDPSLSKKKYFKYLKDEYKIPPSVSRYFRMNPVDIMAEVICDTKNKAIAVVVFESQRKNFLDEQKIRLVYNDNKRGFIVSSLDKLKEQKSPDIKTAKEANL